MLSKKETIKEVTEPQKKLSNSEKEVVVLKNKFDEELVCLNKNEIGLQKSHQLEVDQNKVNSEIAKL